MRSRALRRAVTAAATTALALSGLTALAGPAAADPQPGKPSNMGLCSSYLADLPAPAPVGETLGGNARSGVNLLILRMGHLLPDRPENPGDLYKVRARQHPTDPAAVECTPRPRPPQL